MYMKAVLAYIMKLCIMYGVFANLWQSRSVGVIKGLCIPSSLASVGNRRVCELFQIVGQIM